MAVLLWGVWMLHRVWLGEKTGGKERGWKLGTFLHSRAGIIFAAEGKLGGLLRLIQGT